MWEKEKKERPHRMGRETTSEVLVCRYGERGADEEEARRRRRRFRSGRRLYDDTPRRRYTSSFCVDVKFSIVIIASSLNPTVTPFKEVNNL